MNNKEIALELLKLAGDAFKDACRDKNVCKDQTAKGYGKFLATAYRATLRELNTPRPAGSDTDLND